jgi:hypothetical protein
MSPRETALVAIAEEFVSRCEAGTILSQKTYRKMVEALALPSDDREIYPGSDLGLAQMCPGVPVETLRGIQAAAFRAGRESAFMTEPQL